MQELVFFVQQSRSIRARSEDYAMLRYACMQPSRLCINHTCLVLCKL